MKKYYETRSLSFSPLSLFPSVVHELFFVSDYSTLYYRN